MFQRTEHGDIEIQLASAQHHDHVAWLNSEAGENVGEAVRTRGELGIGDLAADAVLAQKSQGDAPGALGANRVAVDGLVGDIQPYTPG